MGSLITDWRQKEVIAVISGRMVKGMDSACNFVAEQAMAITRHERIRRHIKYEIVVEGNKVIGRVGVEKSFETGRGGYISLWLELGTGLRQRRIRGTTGIMPAQPYLRPAVFGNAKRIVQLIAGGK